VTQLRRRAKYILADLDSGETLVIHLGMSGRMSVYVEGKQRRIGNYVYDKAPEGAATASTTMWCSRPTRPRASFSTIIAASA
jgi:formamidopyrimidine-DNA glycosylase